MVHGSEVMIHRVRLLVDLIFDIGIMQTARLYISSGRIHNAPPLLYGGKRANQLLVYGLR
jgi:hypothetical protein